MIDNEHLIGLKQLVVLKGGGEKPDQPPLPPAFELIRGEGLTASAARSGPRRRSRRPRRGGAA